jgi:hypothetical protein
MGKRIDERHPAGKIDVDAGYCPKAGEIHEANGKSRMMKKSNHLGKSGLERNHA